MRGEENYEGVVPLGLGSRPRGVRWEQDCPVTEGAETGGKGGPNAEKNKF